MYAKLETPTMTERSSGGNSALEPINPPLQGVEGEDGSSQTGRWALFPIIATTFAAFVLLTLTTFSLPFLPQLYFLWSSQAGGVRFGIWGWCLEQGLTCSDRLGMGYTWEPEVAIPITKALALYPVAAISSFMALLAFVPILREKTPRTLRVLQVLTWTSFAFAAVVFVFMIAMWSVADERFKAAGWKVHWGPLPWMSFMATLLLLISSINAAKVASWSGPHFLNSKSPAGRATTAQEDQGTNQSDLEKAHVPPIYAASSSSSPLKDTFAVPVPGQAHQMADLKRESSFVQDHDESYTSRSSDEIDGKPSHCYDDLSHTQARYQAGRSSAAAAAKAKKEHMTERANTATAAFPAIPDIVQVALPPRAFRHDSLQREGRV